MTSTSLVRKRQDRAATFVERKDEVVVVTVGDDRIEITASEWDGLPPWQGQAPSNFDRAPQEVTD